MNQNASMSTSDNSNISSKPQSEVSSTPRIVEFSVTAPKNPQMSVQLMNFPKSLNFTLEKVKKAQIKRDVPATGSVPAEEQPTFGAGSRFGGRNKFTPNQKKVVVPKNVPYTLKTKSQDGAFKKFTSRHERGETESSVYYVLVRGAQGFQALPLEEWHTFRSVSLKNINTANVEEVEDVFKNRNHLRIASDEKDGGEKGKGENSHRSSDFSSDDESDKEVEKQRKRVNSKRRQQNSDDEAADESDDGVNESREVDYLGDNSDEESEPELLYVDSVAEEADKSNEKPNPIGACAKESEKEASVPIVPKGRKRKANDGNVAEKSTKKVKTVN